MRRSALVNAQYGGAGFKVNSATGVGTLMVSFGTGPNENSYAKCSGIGANALNGLIHSRTQHFQAKVLHELHHAYDFVRRGARGISEQTAVDAEDEYNAAAGQRLRCFYY